jgi:hypothetical protein
MKGWASFELCRRRAQELEEQRKPQPAQINIRHRLAGMARRAEQIRVNRLAAMSIA